jgi:hypothetical protein
MPTRRLFGRPSLLGAGCEHRAANCIASLFNLQFGTPRLPSISPKKGNVSLNYVRRICGTCCSSRFQSLAGCINDQIITNRRVLVNCKSEVRNDLIGLLQSFVPTVCCVLVPSRYEVGRVGWDARNSIDRPEFVLGVRHSCDCPGVLTETVHLAYMEWHAVKRWRICDAADKMDIIYNFLWTSSSQFAW